MLINEGVRVAGRRRLNTRAQLDPVAAAFGVLRQHLAASARASRGSI